MSRLGLLGLVCVALGLPSAGPAFAARRSQVNVTIGPMRLISPDFGYVVAERTVQGGNSYDTRIRLLVLDNGHWRDASPPALRRPAFPRDGVDAVDDVAFFGRRDGWLATFDCSTAGVHLYRTRDGGRSWRSLGTPSGHSCSAPGTTFLSFVDARHGWMEPVSPTGPVGILDVTTDGGRAWKHVATGPDGPGAPCPVLRRSGSSRPRRVGWAAATRRKAASSRPRTAVAGGDTRRSAYVTGASTSRGSTDGTASTPQRSGPGRSVGAA